MDKSCYKHMLEDRIENIRSVLDNIHERLDNNKIDYPEFLYLESNLYNDLISTQRELYDLDRKAVL